MQSSLVLELQALAISRDTSVVQLARTAKLVAVKLGLADAVEWIESELNGYEDLPALPAYRRLRGECQAFNPYRRRWIPVNFRDVDIQSLCSDALVSQPLGSIESVINAETDHAFFSFSFQQERELQRIFQENMKFGIRIAKNQLEGIFDAVRNLVLNWSLELEQAGVLGENMSFTLTEKRGAKPVSQQFFIQNAGVVGNVTDNATVTNHQTVNGSLSVDRIRELIQQAKSALPALPPNTASQVRVVLDELDAESRQSAPNEGKLRGALTSLRTVCEGAAGNLVASGIVTAVTALLQHVA